MKLLLIRHGQTDFNKNKIPQGQEIDAPLNGEGLRQIEEAARCLPDDIDFIISSPMKRTSQTAEILNKRLNRDIEFNDDIKELRYGSLAGKTWPEIEIETGDKNVKEKDDDITFDYSKFGGDTAADLKQRVRKFIENQKNANSDKTILVVTHGGVIDTMHILYPQSEKKETKNGTIHEFDF